MHQRRRLARRGRPGASALAVVVLCLVTACTSGKSPERTAPTKSPTSPTAASPTDSPDPVTLRFAVYGQPVEVAAYRRLARVYKREAPHVTVRVEAVPDAVTGRARIGRQTTAGTAPDVFLTDSGALPSLVENEQVRPVDLLLEERDVQFGDNFERLGLEAFAADSALQCMPSEVSPYVVYFNRRLLDLSVLVPPGTNPPRPEANGWRWPVFTAAAQSMSRGRVKGVYLPPQLTTLTPLLRSAGDDIVDDRQEPSTLTLSDEDTRVALETILTVARDANLNPTPAELAKQDAVTRFKNGRLGMMIGTRDLVPQLRRKRSLRFDVYPLPSLGRFQTIAEVSGYCIARDTEHVEEAADFLAFASSKTGAELTARSGAVVPANLSVLYSEAFEQPGRFPVNVEVFSNVLRRADMMPNPPGWSDVVGRTQPMISRLFYAPILDLDTFLPRIDALSKTLLAPTPTPTPTPSESPSESPSPSPSPTSTSSARPYSAG